MTALLDVQRTATATYMGREVALSEFDLTGLSTTRAVVAYVRVPVGQTWVALPVGALTWDRNRHTIELVFVTEAMRRKGVATELLRVARAVDPQVVHSSQRSPSGSRWAASTGDPLPKVALRMGDADAHARGSGLLAALHGLGPDRVIAPR